MVDSRVLIVADDPLARAGLATLLAGFEGWTVAGGVAAGAHLAEDLDLFRADVLLWDAGWDLDETAQAALLARVDELQMGGVPLLLLLPEADGDPAAALWEGGVRCLLPRDSDPGRLDAALRACAAGLAVLDPALLPAPDRFPFEDANAGPDSPKEPLEPLTPRELDVLRQLAEGRTNREIALTLGISVHTVKFHVNALLAKLNAASRTEAVVRASRLGLIYL